jgi:hypothetical protein
MPPHLGGGVLKRCHEHIDEQPFQPRRKAMSAHDARRCSDGPHARVRQRRHQPPERRRVGDRVSSADQQPLVAGGCRAGREVMRLAVYKWIQHRAGEEAANNGGELVGQRLRDRQERLRGVLEAEQHLVPRWEQLGAVRTELRVRLRLGAVNRLEHGDRREGRGLGRAAQPGSATPGHRATAAIAPRRSPPVRLHRRSRSSRARHGWSA